MEKPNKGEMRIVEMHIVLDENGKVKVPQQLMEALGIKEGDMLSFIADDEGFRVKGGKKPPYFHADTTAPARGSLKSMPVEPTKVVPTPLASKPELTQMTMFEGGSQPVRRQKRK